MKTCNQARGGEAELGGARFSVDSEVNCGEVALPQWSTMKRQVLYQGTASAVPERDERDGLQPLDNGQGLKPTESALSAARLKPCPDTRRPTSGSGSSLPRPASRRSPSQPQFLPRNRRARRGSALLMVLWLSAALTVIGFSLATTIRGETDRTSTALDGLRSYYLAAAGIDRASLELLWGLQNPGSRTIPEHATQVIYHFASGDVRVEFIPETAKLNVNRATLEVLTRLGMALGLDEARAGELAHSIDQSRRPGGGGAAGIGATPSFPSTGASLQEIEELLSVPGVTPELFYGTYVPQQDASGKMQLSRRAGLADCLTVYGLRNEVDANTAEPAVLAAIGMNPGAIAALVEQRRQGPITPDQLGNVRAGAGPLAASLRVGGHSIVTMRATARLHLDNGQLSSLRRTVAASIKYMPAGYPSDSPIHVLRWYDTAWSE